MKVKSTIRRHLLLAASSLLAASYAQAQDQDGWWLGDSADDWTDGTKWTGGLIANGADFTVAQSPDARKFARLKVVIMP